MVKEIPKPGYCFKCLGQFWGGDKDMCVDVKKKAVDERLAEVDIFFFIVELIFLNVDENILKVNE